MKYRTFFIFLAIFIVVAGSLNWLLNPAPPLYPSIGGGGYDLSKPVYTLLLLIFTCLWSLVMLISGLISKKPIMSRQYFILAAIGLLSTIASFAAYHNNLT
ncbi:hypothetical protein [Pseudochrobactrum kiredjianiae]|uniref:Uncharacterized protein n=1 Tax=Pseudochrobactrum kiredjianiae TaxID=386305 RepID=A0ABW3V3V2_9HYPH|nr:hypothetical protein [Pseudochrobactrum kiredjianiae]MDM7852597.1 hypothetical protein [Pseudochrobactrum kiredjianiae]